MLHELVQYAEDRGIIGEAGFLPLNSVCPEAAEMRMSVLMCASWGRHCTRC